MDVVAEVKRAIKYTEDKEYAKAQLIYQDILINFRGFVISKNAGKLNICGYQVKNIEDIDTTNFCIIVALLSIMVLLIISISFY